MEFMIREASVEDIHLLTSLIRESFSDVAERFSLTPDNCPTHPSFCTPQWVESAMDKGIRFYVVESGDEPCGCVAMERHDDQVCYLERLAVLPRFRRRGFGKALTEHVFDQARKMGAQRVEIGIISEHTELQDWYQGLGFVVTGTTSFDHLPFKVDFMAREPLE
jgi:N-acetylglutamate synthase-like GNAT family acetyltransferase